MDSAARRSRTRSPWPLVVGRPGRSLAILVGGVAFVAHRAISLPAEVAREGRKALAELRSLAAAFRRAASPPPSPASPRPSRAASRLQFATLRQVEVFSRRDERSLFWGQLALPDVVVEARVPVEYTYFLDLEKPWTFTLEGERLLRGGAGHRVEPPALDASALRYEVREGSVLRDEAAVARPCGRA